MYLSAIYKQSTTNVHHPLNDVVLHYDELTFNAMCKVVREPPLRARAQLVPQESDDKPSGLSETKGIDVQ